MKRSRILQPSLSATLGRYTAAGALGYLVNLAVMVGLVEVAGVEPRLSGAVAIAVSLILNFFLARHAIFHDASGHWKAQFWRFLVVSVVFRGAEYLMFLILIDTIGLHYTLGMLVALVVSNLSKFVAYRQYVFRSGVTD